jgi:hypothetical protein
MSTSNSQLVPINVAARWLRVPVSWLRAEAEAGRIPCLRAGKAILCDFAAVEAALLERARQEKGDAAEQYDQTAVVQTEPPCNR